MPCVTPEQNATEAYRQRTAQLYLYVLRTLGELIPPVLESDAHNSFCHADWTLHLCGRLKDLQDTPLFDTLVYNPRERTSRRLADWWEEHQRVDMERESREQKELERRQLRAEVLAKLTPDEIEALDLKG